MTEFKCYFISCKKPAKYLYSVSIYSDHQAYFCADDYCRVTNKNYVYVAEVGL